MEALELARWQFGITTVYHFFFVPITIGLSFLVAGLELAWVRTRDEKWLRLTKFFGKLFLINFAMGIVTGIVQEFQFGMNWSDYSRFVGDIFGAPLAVEGLLAFFLESTFLGLWIFGWDKLSPALHNACMWIAAIGTALSAYFILAANSFMQNPVGYTFNAERGRAELESFTEVLTNKVVLITLPHTLFGAFMVAGGLMAAVSMWWLIRRKPVDADAFRSTLRLGAVTLLVAGLGTVLTGDIQGKVMTEVQPMKMAAAEALYETQEPAPFSILTVGSLDGDEPFYQLEVPHLLSYLATGTWNGEVQGINNLQAEYEETYGPGNYKPYIPVTYWSFRLMITCGALAMAIGAWMLWVTRKGRVPRSDRRWPIWLAVASTLLPLFANSFGWIFTEMGRQPWIVFGLMRTEAGVSPNVGAGTVLTSLIVFTLLYGALAVVEVKLLLSAIKKGLPDVDPDNETGKQPEDKPMAFAY
ncbi:cytochrome ubiquinol oxidase subunit I [Mumia zhuanghuii]|uniref:Cytochrome ubiquinol oxidase subunit I n=1 Tax=Mumia zhuanghuii TaxID=2585211 RepID=A0A5C4M8T7_9ACTN|nr:cytochrome ubiquinol oxidase subunit I [Mumia zhuanghuii]TNC30442.1 cytochrome ubiquinol oxidase subunit I [Mumia zhuanghuii]TNC45366.1 cytochrome ubiquinol oxidase subunit I [Mumia zhuanghuii]